MVTVSLCPAETLCILDRCRRKSGSDPEEAASSMLLRRPLSLDRVG